MKQLLNRIKLWQKALILVAVTLIFELAFVTTLMQLLQHSELQMLREANAKSIMYETARLSMLFYEASAKLAAFNLTRSKQDEEQFEQKFAKIQEQNDLINRLAADASIDWGLKDKEAEVARALRVLDKVRLSMDQTGRLISAEDRKNLTRLIWEVSTSFRELVNQAKRSSDPLDSISARAKVQQCLQLGIVLNVVLALLLVFAFHQTMAKRLFCVLRNTTLFADRKQLLPPLSGTDEIAHIDRVFHEMAAALGEALRKERAVLDNALDVIFSIDLSGMFITSNPACETLWGFSVEELRGRSITALVHPDDVADTQRHLVAIKDGADHGQLENRIICKDGQSMEMVWSVHWTSEDQAFFCVAHDVSERKNLDRIKQEFFAMVTHDLRTPLQSVLSTLNLMATGVAGQLPSKAERMVSKAEASTYRLIGLINDLLEIEKIKSGSSFEYNIGKVLIETVIEHSVNVVKSLAEAKNIAVQVPDSAGIEIYADGERLIRVLVNLLGNAINYSPKGGCITISVATAPGNEVEIGITDEGPGIAESDRKVIFDRFTQVGTKKDRGGTGLGLAICKQIVAGHGGTIGVDSEEGKGSTFWIRLPNRKVPGRSSDQVDERDE